MAQSPTLVLIPGAWHKASCFDKIITSLHEKHNLKCVAVTLPSTCDNREATFKDDIDAARRAITEELEESRDVIVVAHSYGGMIGNSAIKGLTKASQTNTDWGYVKALVLIASGFTITGLSFMDPLFGIPPPTWRINSTTGYAELVADPRDLFYHDVPAEEVEHHVQQLTTQSLKALFEGGEHVYTGWKDVPTWYVGTSEDHGLPVVLQRVQVGMARGQGAIVHHVELPTSHSPFLSRPDDVVAVILEAVATTGGQKGQPTNVVMRSKGIDAGQKPSVRLLGPLSWIKYGIPYTFGRVLGWTIFGFFRIRRVWRN